MLPCRPRATMHRRRRAVLASVTSSASIHQTPALWRAREATPWTFTERPTTEIPPCSQPLLRTGHSLCRCLSRVSSVTYVRQGRRGALCAGTSRCGSRRRRSPANRRRIERARTAKRNEETRKVCSGGPRIFCSHWITPSPRGARMWGGPCWCPTRPRGGSSSGRPCTRRSPPRRRSASGGGFSERTRRFSSRPCPQARSSRWSWTPSTRRCRSCTTPSERTAATGTRRACIFVRIIYALLVPAPPPTCTVPK